MATDGFRIQRSTNGIDFIQIGEIDLDFSSTTFSYLDTTVVVGTTYYYRVQRFSPTRQSNWSNTVSILFAQTDIALTGGVQITINDTVMTPFLIVGITEKPTALTINRTIGNHVFQMDTNISISVPNATINKTVPNPVADTYALKATIPIKTVALSVLSPTIEACKYIGSVTATGDLSLMGNITESGDSVSYSQDGNLTVNEVIEDTLIDPVVYRNTTDGKLRLKGEVKTKIASLREGSRIKYNGSEPLIIHERNLKGNLPVVKVCLAGSVHERFSDVVIPAGTQDCQNIINQAIIDLNARGGGILHIFEGVYPITDSIYLRDNVTMQGVGFSTVIKVSEQVPTQTGNFFMVINHGGDITPTYYNYNVVVKDMLLDGNATNLPVGTFPLNRGVYGFYIYKGYYCHAYNIRAKNMRNGISYELAYYCNVVGTIAEEVTSLGMYFYLSKYCHITDNFISGTATVPVDEGVFLGQFTYSNFSRNYISYTGGNGIDSDIIDYSTFDSNIITDYGKNSVLVTNTGYDGVCLAGRHVTFTNNVIANNTESKGIWCEADYSVISGNIFSDVGRQGIYVTSCIESVFSNNIVSNPCRKQDNYFPAITIDSATKCLVANNMIHAPNASLRPTWAINVTASASSNIIRNNDITTSGVQGVINKLGTGNIYGKNRLTGTTFD